MANPETPQQSHQWWQQWLDGLAARHAAFPVGENKRAIPPYWALKGGQHLTAENGCVLEEHIASGGHIGIIPGRLNCLVIDIDVPKGPDNPEVEEAVAFVIGQLGLPLLRYDTPSGGVHLWYRTENPQWRSRNLYMGDRHFGELRCDAGYIVAWDIQRVAGGLEYWPNATPVTEAKRQALLPKRPALASDDEEKTETPATAPEGQRNDTLNRQAFADFSKSQTPAEAAYAAINNIAEAMENPNPQKRDEILATMRSAARGALGEAATDGPSVEAWEPSLRGREFLVPMIAQRGKITRLCGEPKAGKSVVLASLLARLSRKGAPLPGCDPSPGYQVLYLPLEEDREEDVNPRLTVAKANFKNIRKVTGMGGLTGKAFADAIRSAIAACENWKPDIIGIDPMAVFARKVNDADSVRETLGALASVAKQFSAAIIVVDHSAKMTKKRMTETNNIADLGAGSVQISATVRLAWNIFKDEEKNADKDAEPERFMVYAGGNPDWVEDEKPVSQYRLETTSLKLQPGVTGRCVTDFVPTSGQLERFKAEANGRVAPCVAEEAILALLADGRCHLLSEITDIPPRTVARKATQMANAGELECISAHQAKKDGRLDAEVPNNRAKAYAKSDIAGT